MSEATTKRDVAEDPADKEQYAAWEREQRDLNDHYASLYSIGQAAPLPRFLPDVSKPTPVDGWVSIEDCPAEWKDGRVVLGYSDSVARVNGSCGLYPIFWAETLYGPQEGLFWATDDIYQEPFSPTWVRPMIELPADRRRSVIRSTDSPELQEKLSSSIISPVSPGEELFKFAVWPCGTVFNFEEGDIDQFMRQAGLSDDFEIVWASDEEAVLEARCTPSSHSC